MAAVYRFGSGRRRIGWRLGLGSARDQGSCRLVSESRSKANSFACTSTATNKFPADPLQICSSAVDPRSASPTGAAQRTQGSILACSSSHTQAVAENSDCCSHKNVTWQAASRDNTSPTSSCQASTNAKRKPECRKNDITDTAFTACDIVSRHGCRASRAADTRASPAA